MMMKLAICLLFLTLTACSHGHLMVGAPWKQEMLFEGPPNSPPKFKEGWRDGCETSIAMNANNFQKFFYTFKQNSALAQDPEYYAAWKAARDYCQKYVFNYLHTELVAGELGDGLESVWKTQATGDGDGPWATHVTGDWGH